MAVAEEQEQTEGAGDAKQPAVSAEEGSDFVQGQGMGGSEIIIFVEAVE